MADYFTGTWRLVVSIVWDAYKGDQTPPGRVRQLEEGVERLISDQQALVDIVPLALKAGHEIDFKSLDDNLDEKALIKAQVRIVKAHVESMSKSERAFKCDAAEPKALGNDDISFAKLERRIQRNRNDTINTTRLYSKVIDARRIEETK